MRAMAGYLTLTGAATMAGGWLTLRLADRAVGLSIQTKTFLSALIANGVALLNVVIVAQLMFVSTAHDLKLLIALICFSAIVGAFFSLWIASAVGGRIEIVAAAIRNLAGGDYTDRISVDGGDEVAQLAKDVNRLAERLDAAEEQRRALDRERMELTAAISHDLRTPLASVRAMVEALDDHVVSDEQEVRRYYRTMRREIERLNRMIDDLFELAQLDAGALRLERRMIALHEIAAEVIDAMQPQAQRAGVTIDLSMEDGLPELLLDGARIERVTANLLRNALEHSPSNGRIDVSVYAENGYIALRVSDTGEGIEPAELDRVWERFYRSEQSRHRAPGVADGAGLGLAIVRGFVDAHGGAVDVESTPGEGATFTIRIPRV